MCAWTPVFPVTRSNFTLFMFPPNAEDPKEDGSGTLMEARTQWIEPYTLSSSAAAKGTTFGTQFPHFCAS